MLSFEAAKPRDILSLENWTNGNACLARDETAYLTHCRELLSVASSDDNATTRLESWVEDNLIRFCQLFRKVQTDSFPTYQRRKLNVSIASLSRYFKWSECTHILGLEIKASSPNSSSIPHYCSPVSPCGYLQRAAEFDGSNSCYCSRYNNFHCNFVRPGQSKDYRDVRSWSNVSEI